jgi:hypothetical protein
VSLEVKCPLAWWLLLALAALACAAPASAHDTSYSALDLRLAPQSIAMRVTLHPADLAWLLGEPPPVPPIDVRRWQPEGARLAEIVAARITLTADRRRLEPEFIAARPREDGRGLALEFRVPWKGRPGRLDVSARLLPDDPQHQTFLNVYDGARVIREEVLDARHASTSVFGTGGAGIVAVASSFVPAGIHHIFTGPDHILFVVGLLLLGGSLGRLLKIVTGFTLAHSVTLALAALGLVNPPSHVIEPLIALSIVLVGIENLVWRPGSRDRRAWIAFGFGFIHGFGFAAVLRETGLPREALSAALVSFNVGVEIGQACIVLVVVPALAWLRARAPRFVTPVTASGSWLVVVAGGYWLVRRVMGS